MNITVSCPPISDNFAYYTYIECIIRSTLKKWPVNFNDPIFYRFNRRNINQLDDTLRNTDILMLSCYVWNWELQLILADRARDINPRVTVIAGGPHISEPYYDRFDHVIIGEAEDGLNQIFMGNQEHVIHSKRKTDFDVSPYIDNKDFVIRQKKLAKDRGLELGIIFETNRGCPFACAYCDWGSATMSKVRQFDLQRTYDEIEFVCNELKPNFWFHADANFGLTDKDIDVANHLVKTKSQCGYPKTFYYSPSKNTVKRNIELAKILWDGKVIDTFNIGIQHADKDVLMANQRGNITPAQFERVGKELINYGIPANTQMILGMPGDTREKWFDSLCQIFEWGFHSETKVYWYNLLPNAPAAHPDYMDQWQIETKPIIYNQSRLVTGKDDLIDKAADVIVACKTFDREDWVEMNIETRYLQALHNFGILRNVASYYRFAEGIPFKDFYKDVIDTIRMHDLGQEFDRQYSAYLNKLLTTRSKNNYVPFYWNKQVALLEPEDILVLHLLEHKDELFLYLAILYDHDDLLRYQKDILIDINYNPDIGRKISMRYDWIKYFNNMEFGEFNQSPPTLNKRAEYETNQKDIIGPTDFTSSRILWHKTNNTKRKGDLFKRAALGQIDWRGEQRLVLKQWSKIPPASNP